MDRPRVTAPPAFVASLLVALVAAGALALTACGGTSTSASSSPSGASGGGAPSAAASPSESPSSAPAVGTIAFMKETKVGGKSSMDIYLIRTDGTGLKQLTAGRDAEIAPAWSPDGSKIAYRGGDGAVWVMNADASGKRRLTESTVGTDFTTDCPSWSPDGKRIVFQSIDKVTNGWHLDVVNADGSGRTELTGGGAYQPIWAPDGTIFFNNLDMGEIYTVDPDGGGSPQGIGLGAWEDRFSLSPDGKQLVMPEARSDRIALYETSGQGDGVVIVDGLPPYSTDGAYWWADWSSDGRAIAFGIAHDGNPGSALYIVNVDGTGLRKVPNTGEVWDPVWRPQ